MRWFVLLSLFLSSCNFLIAPRLAQTCDEADFQASCDGPLLSTCQGGFVITTNCGDLTCNADLGACTVAVVQLDAGLQHTCAVLETGTVRCWGLGLDGRLGYGNQDNIGDDEPPFTVGDVDLGAGVKAIQVVTGNAHTCALLDTGTVRCWGSGSNGQLGYGNTNSIGDDEPPSAVADVDLGAGVRATQITAGGVHTCALLETGGVRCWGLGGFGQLGYGNTNNIGDDEPPSAVADVDLGAGVRAIQIDAGNQHTCALLDTGTVRCWGRGILGRLGYGNENDIGDDEPPSAVADVDLGAGIIATQIAVGGDHTCALLDTGTIRCWGSAVLGALGYGNTNSIGDDEPPSAVADVDLGAGIIATQITTGVQHTCALLDTGTVRCWGAGGSGRLGYGNEDTIGDDEPPSAVADVQVF